MILNFVQDRLNVQRLLIAALIGAALCVAAAVLPRENILQGWISDLKVAARSIAFGEEPLSDSRVLVLGEDERSLDAPELVNRPRALFSPIYAGLAEKMFSYGAKGMIMDVILTFDSKDLKVGDETPLRRYDVPLLKVLRAERERGRLVLGRSSELLPAQRFTRMAGPLGLAMVQVPFGTSNVIRQVPTRLADTQGKFHSTLSGRGLSLLGHEDPPEWVDIMPRGLLTSLPSASMIDVLRCGDEAALRELLEGRIVYIGGMLPSEDRLKTPDQLIPRQSGERRIIAPDDTSVACDFPAPHTRHDYDKTLPGVYVHAGAADAVDRGWRIEIVPLFVEIMTVFIAGFVACFLAFLLPPVLGGLALGGLIGAVFFGAVTAFELGYNLPVSWAIMGAPLALVLGYGVRIRLVDRKSNMIRREFGRYLSPVLVQQMVDKGQMPKMGGEEREVTVMFADLSGFTATSESVESARLVPILNRYLDTIAQSVQEHGGYVDKFIGDAVMSMFNAPIDIDDHALRGVTAAQQLVRNIQTMAKKDEAAGEPSFGIKVGLSTGISTVGNVGSQDRVNYTVVGENVNLAARFESLPSVLKTPIVIGPEAARQVKDHFTLLRLVSIRVKGKTKGVDVFAPLYADEVTDSVQQRMDEYAAALKLFEEGAFEEAATAWDGLAELDWPGAGPASALAAHSRIMMNYTFEEPWDGVLETRSK